MGILPVGFISACVLAIVESIECLYRRRQHPASYHSIFTSLTEKDSYNEHETNGLSTSPRLKIEIMYGRHTTNCLVGSTFRAVSQSVRHVDDFFLKQYESIVIEKDTQ